MLIALGESIVVIGATYADGPWDRATAAGLISTFVGGAALWWTYFDTAAENMTRAFREANDRGAVARTAYTYLHAVLIIGIVVMAAGDELLLAHPRAMSNSATVACIVGGPAIFLIGNAAFRRTLHPKVPTSHIIGLAMLAAVALVAPRADRLTLGILVAATLATVAALGTALHARDVRRLTPARINGS